MALDIALIGFGCAAIAASFVLVAFGIKVLRDKD